MIAKFAKILRVTGVKTGVGVLIFDVNRSRIGVGFCNFGAGLESESQKSDFGHLCSAEMYTDRSTGVDSGRSVNVSGGAGVISFQLLQEQEQDPE